MNTLYERIDDGTVPGHADLREIDHRTLQQGDTFIVPLPPNDVHGFTALTDMTLFLGVFPGRHPEFRRYFDLETKTYFQDRRTPV